LLVVKNKKTGSLYYILEYLTAVTVILLFVSMILIIIIILITFCSQSYIFNL